LLVEANRHENTAVAAPSPHVSELALVLNQYT